MTPTMALDVLVVMTGVKKSGKASTGSYIILVLRTSNACCDFIFHVKLLDCNKFVSGDARVA